MLRFHPSRFIWVLALMLGIWMVGSQAQEYRYHYVSISKLVPEGYGCFDLTSEVITNSGRVYGTTYSPPPDYCYEPTADNIPYVAVYKNGAITVLQKGRANTGNEGGTIGGAVFDEKKNVWRAALFDGNKVKILPQLSENELGSYVAHLTDSGIALVVSTNSNDWPPTANNWSYALYKNGRLTLLNNFGVPDPVPPSLLWINNEGLIAGTIYVRPRDAGKPDRAFQFNPRKGELTLLNPLSPDTLSWSQGINNRGNVLGYSFTDFGVPARIGIWSNQGQFETYFDESTSGFVSDIVRFNDNNLIVISAFWYGSNYLVPKPGVLLDLASLVVDFPPGFSMHYIEAVNNHGDMLGDGCNPCSWTNYVYDTFLLLRIGPGKPLK